MLWRSLDLFGINIDLNHSAQTVNGGRSTLVTSGEPQIFTVWGSDRVRFYDRSRSIDDTSSRSRSTLPR